MHEIHRTVKTQDILDTGRIRKDFPILSKTINGKPLVYLDNAATTQKPLMVMNRVRRFEGEEYATVRRGAYKLGSDATILFEEVRKKIATFLGNGDPKEIIFTGGTTQSINLVAYSYGRKFIKAGDEIIISLIEHHANMVPWQILCRERGAKLRIIPVNDRGELVMEEYEKLLNEKTRLVCITHVSNALGTVNPVKEITAMAHTATGAKVLIDGAQSVPHMKIDVKDLDCDFFAFSGHKAYGPSGVGVLYGKMDILESMPPFLAGGDMIASVTLDKTTFANPPSRFEAGTPPISQVIGLGAALDYIHEIGPAKIDQYEKELLNYGTKLFSDIPGLKIIGTAQNKTGILSFTLDNVHPHDIVTLLDMAGVALRGGHHCAQPTMQRFNVPATTRASLSFYNTFEELDILAEGIYKAREVFL